MNRDADLLASIRKECPALGSQAYLNTGTAGPLPRRTIAAINDVLERQFQRGRAHSDPYLLDYFPLRSELRGAFARVLGCATDEVAITHHTTEGMNIAIWGLNWQPGDEIVTTTHEHEGALLPIYAAARRFGLTVRFATVGASAEQTLDALTRALSQRTRMVVVSHVSWKTGAVLPVREIAAAAHRVGALCVVDGAQAAGTMAVDVHALGVDAYAIPGQKWLCGPEGAGALYVSDGRISELSPTFVGGFGLRDFDAADGSGYFLPATGAARYEVGTVYWPALFGMRESLRWLEETIGWEWIFTRGHMMTRHCREVLATVAGLALHSPEDNVGLTAFTVTGLNVESTVIALAERGITIRSLHHQPAWLRASTGFFNDESDLERLRDGLLALQPH
jgi:L-cysteine/cystine lyase